MLLLTERLRIVPLTLPQLNSWLHAVPALERELGCRCPAPPCGEFGRIVEGQRTVAAGDAEHYLFHTFWLLIERAGNEVVGSACFKGTPNAGGEIEIGYGLEPGWEKQGYMTEAVRALCAWAGRQPGVRHVTAETAPDNLASQRVLQRAGFSPCESGASRWWRW